MKVEWHDHKITLLGAVSMNVAIRVQHVGFDAGLLGPSGQNEEAINRSMPGAPYRAAAASRSGVRGGVTLVCSLPPNDDGRSCCAGARLRSSSEQPSPRIQAEAVTAIRPLDRAMVGRGQ